MRMMKFKALVITFLILILLVMPVTKVYASEASSPKESMIPSISNLYNYKDNKYFSTYKDNYYLDLKETGMFNAWGGKILNTMANLIFTLQVMLSQLVIVIIYYAFELSFFDMFSGVINAVMSNLQQGIFDELVLVCITLIGVFYIIKMAKNQRTQVWTSLIQTIFILVLALSFFRAPDKTLKGIDDLSKGIGQVALEGTFKATNNGKEASSAIEAVSTNLWMMFVHKPWQIFEFGNTDFAEENQDRILSQAPESAERQKVVEEIAKDTSYFQPGVGYSRVAMTLIYFFIFLVQGALILLLCFFMIGFQFLMILYAMFGPFIFLLSLIPMFGMATLKNWCSKIIGFGSMKAIISLVIAILFSFMLAVYDLTDKYGLLIVSLIQVVCLAIVWIKREDVLEGYLKFVSGARQPDPTIVNKALRKDISVENGFKDWVRKRRYDKEEFDDDDVTQSSFRQSSGSSSSRISGGSDTRNTQYDRSNNSSSGYDYGLSSQNNNHDSNIISMNNNLNNLLKVAEDILEVRYEKSKEASEEKADSLGKEPEYSSWVKKVKHREEMNLPKFEEREKLAVVNQIKSVTESGGSIDQLYLTESSTVNESINKPKKLDALSKEPIKLQIEENIQIKTISDKEASEIFVQDFNSEFNKNYNSKFMENVIKKYSQESVKTVLEDMKRINAKETIQNPAGYLTQSLKNNAANVNAAKLDLRGHENFDSPSEPVTDTQEETE